MTTETDPAYRYADDEGEGWLRNGPDGTYTTYPRRDLGELTREQLETERGPLRPVEAMAEEDSRELVAALVEAKQQAVATLLKALNQTALMLIQRNGTVAALLAGRPGSWEATVLRQQVAWLGEDIRVGRVHQGALETSLRLLEQWTTGPVAVELAEGLPFVLGQVAKEAGGWDKITDRWLVGNEFVEHWTASHR